MRYHNIEKVSLTNGTGVRTVLWTAGCEHRCEGCQNPCTWDENGGILFDENAEKELLEALSDKWIEGITFSGGDPLHPANRSEVGRLVKKIKEELPNKNIWLYTGYTWDELLNFDLSWLSLVDVIVEGRFVLGLRNVDLKWCGSENQNVVNVKESLAAGMLVPVGMEEKYDTTKERVSEQCCCCSC